MNPVERVTKTTVAVLKVLTATEVPVWGLEAVRQTGMQSGTVYPILERLQQAGWLTSQWEVDNERNGPRRRYFELTPEGREGALEVIAKYGEKTAAAREAGATDGAMGQSI
ncbi:MAG: hypothetical protein RLZZ626_901 [Actinomycetota bacterium]|jgi:DNA-binding PadR family transcriptional regulator